MDILSTTAPSSTQLNYDDVPNGASVTVTITGVTKGSVEQPVNVELAEYPRRPFKPSKSMRRVLVAAWGPDTSTYTGRKMTLYGDPDITFGKDRVGGIRISHLSNLDRSLTVPLTVTRGKRTPFTIQPLIDHVAESLTDAQIAAATTVEELRAMWSHASSVQQEQIQARVNQLTGKEKTND